MMKPYLKWAVPLAAGMLLPFSLLAFNRFNDPDLGGVRKSTIAEFARRDGQNIDEAVDVTRIANSAEDKRTISDADWKRLLTLYHSTDTDIRNQAILGLGFLGNTPHKSEILSLVRPLLASSINSDQSAALIVLWKLHDPAWKAEAQNRLASKDPVISQAASLIIQRGELPHTWNLH